MPVPHLLALLLAVLLGSSLTACSDDEEPVRQAEVAPTPITGFTADQVRVRRVSFCERVSDEAVAAAVGDLAATRHYGNGEPARLGARSDVAHEWGCVFVGTGGDQARAWVFVPPVTPAQAQGLVRAVGRTPGCTPVDGQDFGAPGTGSVCVRKGVSEAAYRGLFGDAWLTCTVTDGGRQRLSRTALLQRAGDWCVQAATAASD